jgi:hypothetical protein
VNRVLYFIYSAAVGAKPLDEGSALYARVFRTEYSFKDYKWDRDANEWVASDYLGYLTATGSPDLENVAEENLPDQITKF